MTEGLGGVCLLSLCLESVFGKAVGGMVLARVWGGRCGPGPCPTEVFLPKPGLVGVGGADRKGPKLPSSSWLCKERTRISAVGGSYVVIWLEGGDWRTHLGLVFCEICKHVLT